MDASFITPFIESTQSVFKTMLGETVTFKQPTRGGVDTSQYQVAGIIGMSGDVIGAVVLTFPTATAEAAVGAFVGSPMQVTDDDFGDAIGELANMVAGGAKAKLENRNVSISCPSVVTGESLNIQLPTDTIRITIPSTSALGDFAVVVCVKDGAGSSNAAAAGAVAAK